MKTAEEMAQFCQDNNTGSSITKKWRLRHFKVVEKQLYPDEEALSTFMGLHNYKSLGNHDNHFGYAITKDRIICGQKKMIGENVIVINRKNLNDVSKSTGLLLGLIVFDTYKEEIRVQVDKGQANAIHKMITNTLFDHHEETELSQVSNIEQLKQYKELLDLDIITKEEFNKKKEELL
ncbi:PH domain-containing protein [Dolosigranulum pigrum]|uniref:PH domain-containing protein n=1 Tax=Dolosigranulum pigrum TaxID=29394 RepID=UPI001AD8820E|nr:PH domain-containing protein [Dolosigranulum pigrum]